MEHRTILGAALLVSGALCVASAVVAGARLDTAYVRDHTAINQAAFQAEWQGKTFGQSGSRQWGSHLSVMSPVLIWSAFVIGVVLVLTGLGVGIVLPALGRLRGKQPISP
ncbi:MAG TPA: hypothetical protein VG013_27275 [Gemmataceae bacterium]|jgi:hypothetical protein|nr:hypothetical protein [Gemmataceae bacterium]